MFIGSSSHQTKRFDPFQAVESKLDNFEAFKISMDLFSGPFKLIKSAKKITFFKSSSGFGRMYLNLCRIKTVLMLMFVWGWQSYVGFGCELLHPKKTVFVGQMTSQPPLTKSIWHTWNFAPVLLVMKCKTYLGPLFGTVRYAANSQWIPPAMTDSYTYSILLRCGLTKTQVG